MTAQNGAVLYGTAHLVYGVFAYNSQNSALCLSSSAFAVEDVPGDSCAGVPTNAFRWAGAPENGGVVNGPAATAGTCTAVYATTPTTGAGIGVYGAETGASNSGYAVQAVNNSATGWGVYSSGTSPNYFAGKVGIGTTTPATALHVVGDIRYTGVIVDVSDRRAKKDIRPLPSGYLAKIMQLQPVSFVMKDDPKGRSELGLVAQDTERLYPELVQTDPDGTKSLGYAGLVAPLIKAMH